MNTLETIKLFEGLQIRYKWDAESERFFFSVVDIVGVLTEQTTPRGATFYWSKLKERLKKEGADEVLTNCQQLKLAAPDGKQRLTDVADTEGVLRIIQSIPSKKVEPLKRWLASVGALRIDQMIDPELSIDQAIQDYRRKGYSEDWINQRIKTIEIRKGLTDEWKRSGIENESDYAGLTDLMSKIWSGMSTREYKDYKGLTKENLRDNMTNVELMLNGLAEAAATQLSEERNPQGYNESAHIAAEGAGVAKTARLDFEKRLGHSVISPKRAINFTNPPDELPLEGHKEDEIPLANNI